FAARGLDGFAARGLDGFVARGFDGFVARASEGAAALTTAGSWACVSTGGAPAGAGRLSLRRWGRVRGRDPITPGFGSSLMDVNHGATTGKFAADRFFRSIVETTRTVRGIDLNA